MPIRTTRSRRITTGAPSRSPREARAHDEDAGSRDRPAERAQQLRAHQTLTAVGTRGSVSIAAKDVRRIFRPQSTWFSVGVLSLSAPPATVVFDAAHRLNASARGLPDAVLQQQDGPDWQEVGAVKADDQGAGCQRRREAGRDDALPPRQWQGRGAFCPGAGRSARTPRACPHPGSAPRVRATPRTCRLDGVRSSDRRARAGSLSSAPPSRRTELPREAPADDRHLTRVSSAPVTDSSPARRRYSSLDVVKTAAAAALALMLAPRRSHSPSARALRPPTRSRLGSTTSRRITRSTRFRISCRSSIRSKSRSSIPHRRRPSRVPRPHSPGPQLGRGSPLTDEEGHGTFVDGHHRRRAEQQRGHRRHAFRPSS